MTRHQHFERIEVDNNDKSFLRSLEPIVEGIAEAFGISCEVVLHSLENPMHSGIKIVNGHVTGRNVGCPLTDFGLEILEKVDSVKSDVIGSYYGKTEDGKPLKSVTMVIRNAHRKPIGLLCINIDLSAPLLDFMTSLLSVTNKSSFPEHVVEHFPSNVRDLVAKTLEDVMTSVGSRRRMTSSARNEAVVIDLYRRGMFNVRGVIDLVAKQMGVSRYTVYNHIREAKLKVGEQNEPGASIASKSNRIE